MSEACNYDETALYDDATCIYYVDCNGTCGGDWIEDACGNCYEDFESVGDTLIYNFTFTGWPEVIAIPESAVAVEVTLYGATGNGSYGGNGGGSFRVHSVE